jgi:hypothetical protein
MKRTLSTLFLLVAWTFVGSDAFQAQRAATVPIDGDDIGGVVTGPRGPEAGVWVIAETDGLPTKFNKTVVTDDQGRYVIPDLPTATYDVWVRGYGLVDSGKVKATPGKAVNLAATVAPHAQAAAQYYPAGYWLSLLRIPAKTEFPGTGPTGNGIATTMTRQEEWIARVQSLGCTQCHALGSKGTREIPAALGPFPTPVAAWERRIQSGQAGAQMAGAMGYGRDRVLSMFADWTERIKHGAVPPAPPRPQGVERNIVVTQWDFAEPRVYLHDVVSTDRRNPRLYPNGPIYGALELSADYLPVLDPVKHTATKVPLTVRDPMTPATSPMMPAPSPYWGSEVIWTSKNNVHNPMMDGQGRVWITSTVRPAANPDFCQNGDLHPSAKVFPLQRAGRHLAVYDPKTQKLTHISTCYSTHHLMFAEDANNTLWTSAGGGGGAIGWLNTKLFDETQDEVKAQGWSPFVIDTNGNGRRDGYVEPNQPVDPARDKRLNFGLYAVSPAPDGSVWGTVLGFPGAVARFVPGSNPTETGITEYYETPIGNPNFKGQAGFSPRGGDVDRDGVFWAALASGHLASFDRRKCKVTNGPTATGQHCPEGWTLYKEPLPPLSGAEDVGSAEASYYTWVDQFDTFGLGRNIPINTGNGSEGLLALANGKWVVMRVPYPTGYYTKWMDGRIDDPNGGWKGRGLWTTTGTRTPFHMETGRGTSPKVVKFQLRPTPLAK